MYYYYGYHLLVYDLPIFLLSFGLVFILLKTFIKSMDPVMNAAMAAIAASLAYIFIRENVYRWAITNRMSVFGIILCALFLLFAFFIIKFM